MSRLGFLSEFVELLRCRPRKLKSRFKDALRKPGPRSGAEGAAALYLRNRLAGVATTPGERSQGVVYTRRSGPE